MYLTVRQNLKRLSKSEYRALRQLCHAAKNLKNQALYEIRQYFFETHKYLSYNNVYSLLKGSEYYKSLQANVAQHILREVDSAFQSFFGSLKSLNVNHAVHIPHYLPKNGFAELIIQQIRIVNGRFKLPYSKNFSQNHKKIYITIPSVLRDKKVKEIRIVPNRQARYFTVFYAYEAEKIAEVNLNHNKALAIDLGVNNLCTCVTSEGHSFIIDGRKLKSLNQWFNKENARLQSIKDKQGLDRKQTNRQMKLSLKRANRMQNYLGKTAKYIIQYCLKNNVGYLVLGKNEDFQRETKLGKVQNQIFVAIPYGQLRMKLKYQCERYGISFIEQEESYTSKASFWDKDDIPVYQELDCHTINKFSGRRICRGLYRTAAGKLLNADVNGALNILRKSKVVSLDTLYGRGELSTPVRIRVA